MKNVEDVYPLSPMQEVMLFHTLSASTEDTLHNQFCYELEGEIDLVALGRAWQRLVDRHPMLRTRFLWEKVAEPLQVVRETVTLPVELLDWSSQSESEQDEAFREWTQKDRQNRFSPAKAPMMRVTLIHRSPKLAWMVWSNHHLLLDRWCLGTVFRDLFVSYNAELGEGEQRSEDVSVDRLGPPRRFRDYIAWIASQDKGEAALFWKRTLAGFRRASRATTEIDPADQAATPVEQERLVIADAEIATVREFARVNRLTLNNLVQGAWALTLQHFTELSDVVFGAAVSGRPPSLRGVESIVGSFINNVPVRVRMTPESELVPWLIALRDGQQERAFYEHVSLVEIQAESELPIGEGPFDHLLIWLAKAEPSPATPFEMRSVSGTFATAYPLTVSIAEFEDRLEVVAQCREGFRTRAPIADLFRQFHQTLCWMAESGPEEGGAEKPEAGKRLASAPGFRHSAVAAKLVPFSRTAVARRAGPVQNGRPTPEPVTAGREAIDDSLLRIIVLEQWQEVLGRSAIEPLDNFFDIGGNSLAAARLHSGITGATRLVVPILALFRDPSPDAMIQILQKEEWPLTPELATPLRQRGSQAPLFCIASPEVSTVGYAMLSRHLDADQPVYVVQSPPTTGTPKRLSPGELLELADQYVKALETIQPGGDVRLLGMCSGSHIALEMARQLEARGRRPEFLGIINTWAFFTRGKSYRWVRVGQTLAYYTQRLRLLLTSSEGGVWGSARAVVKKAEFLLRLRLSKRKADDTVSTSTPSVSPSPAKESQVLPTFAEPTANPWLDEFGWEDQDDGREKYPGAITVFRLKKTQLGRIRSRGLGWSKQAEGVVVEMIPGDDHDDLLREPNVRDLAAAVQERLTSSTELTGVSS